MKWVEELNPKIVWSIGELNRQPYDLEPGALTIQPWVLEELFIYSSLFCPTERKSPKKPA